MNNLDQPMTQQSKQFYQQNHIQNNVQYPANVNQMNPNFGGFRSTFQPLTPTPMLFNGYDPKTMFNNHGFVNRNDLLYNNLNNILLSEEIREYSILIDSKDRNYQVYPDPFSYEVRFAPLPRTREKVGNRVVTYEEPSPIINDNLVNVRYIKLEEAILPLFTKVRPCKSENEDGEAVTTWKVDTYKPLTENLYVVLSMGSDYKDNNYKSTNDVLSESFATIYYDYAINSTHYKGYTSNGIKIFQQDQLAKIDKLKINFMDPYGKPLSIKHVKKSILSNQECTCEDPEGDDNTNCFKHNLFHPLNPIFQHHIHLKVGIVEPRLNKITFN